MYAYTSRDKIIEQNALLKAQVAMYESQDPIKAMKEICDKRIAYKFGKVAEYKTGWANCRAALKAEQAELSEVKKELSWYKNHYKSAKDALETVKISAERFEKEAKEKDLKCYELENQVKGLQQEIKKLTQASKAALVTKEKEYAKILEAKEKEHAAIEDALKDAIKKLQAQIDHDGTTSGIPTSKTPNNKNKVIPNSREKSGKSKGGQPGHSKKILKAVEDNEVTDTEVHELSKCPYCGGELETLEEGSIDRDEIDYEVKVKKVRHKFKAQKCKTCGEIVYAPIPKNLKAECQYGARVQAMLLAKSALGFVSVARTRELTMGILGQKIKPSMGYVGKLQKRAAGMLGDFIEEVRQYSLRQKILHWDDTVVYMNTERGCFRFYGNESFALYFAHASKGKEGIKQDGILGNLTADTYLMHDHVSTAYNKEYLFKNIECVQHIERALQKIYNDSGHEWARKMKELIQEMIHKRKEYQKIGREKFTEKDTKEFEAKLDAILTDGNKDNEKSQNSYYFTDERNLLARLKEFQENNFAWVYNFELPTTNNLAESSLRMTKTKMKVSGQFLNERTASEFARIRTYTETCRRNGVNEFEALYRLMAGKPYTLSEILATSR